MSAHVPPHPVAGPSGVCGAAGPMLVALLSGDEGAVLGLLRQAREKGADLAEISRGILEPALAQVGEMWHRGELTEAEEHLATALVARGVAVLGAGIPTPSPGSPRILFACLAGEFHDLGTRIAAEVARENGWDAENLGANVPRAALLRFVAQRRPQAVGLSVSLCAHVPECLKVCEELRHELPELKLIVGGFAFRHDPALAGAVQADAVPQDVLQLRDWLRRHAGSARPEASKRPEAPCCLPDGFKKRLCTPRD